MIYSINKEKNQTSTDGGIIKVKVAMQNQTYRGEWGVYGADAPKDFTYKFFVPVPKYMGKNRISIAGYYQKNFKNLISNTEECSHDLETQGGTNETSKDSQEKLLNKYHKLIKETLIRNIRTRYYEEERPQKIYRGIVSHLGSQPSTSAIPTKDKRNGIPTFDA